MGQNNNLSKSSKKLNDEDGQNNPSAFLRGWPGYRTRDGRSGLDPIDTRAEAAHTAGTIIHKLFVGHVRNPIYLFLFGVFGLVLFTPIVLAISELLNGNPFPLDAWIILLIPGIIGLAILINIIRNLISIIFQ